METCPCSEVGSSACSLLPPAPSLLLESLLGKLGEVGTCEEDPCCLCLWLRWRSSTGSGRSHAPLVSHFHSLERGSPGTTEDHREQ